MSSMFWEYSKCTLVLLTELVLRHGGRYYVKILETKLVVDPMLIYFLIKEIYWVDN